MIRLNPTYDTAHPFNPWRLLGEAWDRNWTEKEPPTSAKTWMRSPAGRAATDAFYAAYAEAETVYLAAQAGTRADTSRSMRKAARAEFKAAVRAAAKAWREKQKAKAEAKQERLDRLEALKSWRPAREVRAAVSALMGLRAIPKPDSGN